MYGSSVNKHLWEDTNEKVYDVRPAKVESSPDEVFQCQMRPGPGVPGSPAICAQTEASAEKEEV